MAIFLRPTIAVLLVVIFVVAGIAGGPANGREAALMADLAEARADRPRLTEAVALLTILGGAYVTLALAGVASVWLLARRRRGQALLLAAAVLIERLLVDGLKDWLGRTRPPLEAHLLPHSLAFPSGHAANGMTAFLATALIVTPPAHRRTAVLLAVVLSIAVGLTRVYLGVHWPSDVIGGWTLGLLGVAAAMVIGKRSGALRFEPQHEIVGRHRPALGEDEAA